VNRYELRADVIIQAACRRLRDATEGTEEQIREATEAADAAEQEAEQLRSQRDELAAVLNQAQRMLESIPEEGEVIDARTDKAVSTMIGLIFDAISNYT
jgi:chromosome segregation ATPase